MATAWMHPRALVPQYAACAWLPATHRSGVAFVLASFNCVRESHSFSECCAQRISPRPRSKPRRQPHTLAKWPWW